jgi:hypothetical protein
VSVDEAAEHDAEHDAQLAEPPPPMDAPDQDSRSTKLRSTTPKRTQVRITTRAQTRGQKAMADVSCEC